MNSMHKNIILSSLRIILKLYSLHFFLQRKITLNVFNNRTVSKTYNVIGMIKGAIEPGIFISRNKLNTV